MTITGTAGIASGEEFGHYGGAPIQTLIEGLHGISSAEAFPQPSGVSVDPLTVPVSLYLSY
jgi:hypothetical protein